MSPELITRRDGTKRPRRKGAVQPWAVLWLTAVWVALWHDISVANIASGALLSVGIQLAFPLPPLHVDGRVRPIACVVVYFTILWQVLIASVDVAWKVLRPGRQPQSSVIEVDLASDSDFVLTLVSLAVSVCPGSIVVEARRSTHTLFLHVLDVPDLTGLQAERDRVLTVERRICWALGITQGIKPDRTPVPPTGEAS